MTGALLYAIDCRYERLSGNADMKKILVYFITALCPVALICTHSQAQARKIIPAAECTERYLDLLEGKSIGVVTNHTGMIGNRHLVDSLTALNIHVLKIFSPEHGFRGDTEDGSSVNDGTDPVTGIPVYSLYGAKKKPSAVDLEGIDLMVFDLQDVGVRCFTYLSTLHYVMEACAENSIDLLVLDRPNPNGFYVDGPVLEKENASFIGMHPVPLVYGMTIGEYAQMINGEGWLADSARCTLTVIPCQNYTHRSFYELPVQPSPNLPNMVSVYLYPSLCLFEGTVMSVGRGTDMPFQLFGHPSITSFPYEFTPVSKPGASTDPPYKDQVCRGVDLSGVPVSFLRNNAQIILDWLMEAYRNYEPAEQFFIPYFTKIAGTSVLRQQIVEGKDAYQIRYSWQEAIREFEKTRKKYLLYPDFK